MHLGELLLGIQGDSRLFSYFSVKRAEINTMGFLRSPITIMADEFHLDAPGELLLGTEPDLGDSVIFP